MPNSQSSPAKVDPHCESRSDSSPTGCCADGGRCDEVCIAVVAAVECQRAVHADKDAAASASGCCEVENTDVRRRQCSAVEDEDEDGCDSCCTKATAPVMVTDGCCKPGSGSGGGSGRAKSAIDDTGRGKACCSGYSTCCEGANATETGRKLLLGGQLDSCCSVKSDVSGVDLSTAAADPSPSIVAEFQEACSLHLAEAMRKYRSWLDASICVCRNALGRHCRSRRRSDVCCSQKDRVAVLSNRRNNLLPATEKACCTGEDVCAEPFKPEAETEVVGGVDSEDACGKKKEKKTVTETGHVKRPLWESCCSGRRDSCTEDVLCGPIAIKESSIVTKSLDCSMAVGGGSVRDSEKDAAREHLMFSITGMTCTGCVKKVTGVLDTIHGVSRARVNFVATTGDVEIDPGLTTATDVLRRLERETGFKCSRIMSDRQTLDLDNMTSAAARAFLADLPKGVDSLEKVGKNTFRVSYDPLVIGARAVLERSGGRLAPPSNHGTVSDGRRQLRLKVLSFSGATVFTIPVCVLAFADVPVSLLTKGIVELVLATIVQLIAVSEFYVPALKALIFSKTIEMDMLVVISITAAYVYSIVAFGIETAGVSLEQGPIFETSTLLVTLVLLGRLLASYAKLSAMQAVSLKSLQAETALLEDIRGETTEIDARLLEFNDVIRVPAHSRIVSDGQVVGGESAVDESMLTGESLPVPKTVGDTVTAGTLNGPGTLQVRLTRLPGKNSITDIADLVQNALNSKPRIQDLADVAAGYFVPVVVFVAAVVFAVWIAVCLRIRRQNAGGAIGTAITYAIAVLAISCPCALGLAVPLVLVISGGAAARGGVIIKHADATERGHKVTDIVFDKTGTLTTGALEVVQQVTDTADLSTDVTLAVALSLVHNDTHPVAQAVAAELTAQDIQRETTEAVRSVPGRGIEAVWKGKQVKAGNPDWLGVNGVSTVTALEEQGYTILCVAIDGRLVVSFGLQAKIRPEARTVVGALSKRGLTCHIVSGDQATAVSKIALSLGIHVENTVSRQSPADKQSYIENLRAAGRTTLFVGDGTNDAVAIAAADVGVQIGAASDVTRATADVVLLGGLDGLVTLLEVSRQSFYRIVFNFVWSGLYNLVAILFASGAFVKVRIAPNYAGLGEIVSVLPVVLVALTMLKVRGGVVART